MVTVYWTRSCTVPTAGPPATSEPSCPPTDPPPEENCKEDPPDVPWECPVAIRQRPAQGRFNRAVLACELARPPPRQLAGRSKPRLPSPREAGLVRFRIRP